jgi:hypothetical protein
MIASNKANIRMLLCEAMEKWQALYGKQSRFKFVLKYGFIYYATLSLRNL